MQKCTQFCEQLNRNTLIKNGSVKTDLCGRSRMLKMRICVYTSRQLQWIVINCKRNLQQRQKTLYKKKSRVHILQDPPHIKIGCTPVRFQCRSSKMPRQRVSLCLSLRFCLTLFDRFCLKENSSLSSEFLCKTVGCRGDSAFALGQKEIDFECPRAVRCTWTW